MNKFGNELKEIRKRERLTLKETAERFGIAIATYNNVERGMSSPQSPSSKKILASGRLDAKDRQRLKQLAQEALRATEIEITDADRLGHRRRKNEEYLRVEVNRPKPIGRKIKQAVSKGATQRIFY